MTGSSDKEGDRNLTRRDALRAVAAGGAATAFVGPAAAQGNGNRPPARVVGTASRAAEREAKRRAESVKRTLDFGEIGKAIAGRFSDRAAEKLRQREDVRYVEADGEMRALAQTLPWGVDRVDADIVHESGETGKGAHIVIIDTGIDSNHPDLQANLGTGTAFVSARGPYDEDWDDDNGHGTHCAGIADAVDNSEGVVGVATGATLHAVKVLGRDGSGSFSDVAAGIEWTADHGYDVGSLSLGASSGSETVKDACTYAYNNGVLLVAAAGNSGPCSDCVGYPAAYSECIAVSSTTSDGGLSGFSSTGPEVELAAPGSSIYSTYAGGGYDTLSGTSMACPHVSGAGGQLMANGYSNTEARDRLKSTAEDTGLTSAESGAGLLDVEAAVGSGSSSDSAPSVSWINPSGGETVSGTITAQIDASDSEDSDDSLDVTYTVDGGSSRSTTYNSTSGYYEDSWDTTGVSDGDHTLAATATDSAGNTSSSSITVTTDNTESALAVSTGDATNVGTSSATLNGSLDDLGGASSVDVYFEYGESGTTLESTTSRQTLSSTGSFSSDISGLSSGTDYDYRAVVDASDGDSDTGSTVSFTTSDGSSGDTAPAVDSYTVTEAGSPNPHAEITADWTVSDADGDLDTVVIEVIDSSGSVVDLSTHSVSGSDASGSDDFQVKHADGQTFDVTLTVTDANGNSASETKTVTE